MMNNECSIRKYMSGRKCVWVWQGRIFQPVSVCVCWSGGHTVCPPETDWISSDENRATCPHHNWIKEVIDANQTSINVIDAKQLTVNRGVFKSCLAGRQTDRERDETVFNTVWHFTVSAEQKGIHPPPHTLTHLREWVWLKVQTEFKTCHSTKGLSSEVTSAPQRLAGFCFCFCGGFMFECLCIIERCFRYVCLHWLESWAVKWEHRNLHACRCMHVSHLGESLFAYFLWLWLLNVVMIVCFSVAGVFSLHANYCSF